MCAPRKSKEDGSPSTLTLQFYNNIAGFGKYFHAHLAIAGADVLEDLLAKAIQSTMRPLGRKIKDRLFAGYGPLANLATKIDIAYALSIISKDDYDTLIIIKRIRDTFAHRRKISNFDDPEIATMLVPLKLDKRLRNTEDQFMVMLADVNAGLIAAIRPDLLDELDPIEPEIGQSSGSN